MVCAAWPNHGVAYATLSPVARPLPTRPLAPCSGHGAADGQEEEKEKEEKEKEEQPYAIATITVNMHVRFT